MSDLRILEEDEVSELVRKVEFLDYLVRTEGKSDKVSEVLQKFKDYFEEIKIYNVAVSMFNDYTEGEFTRICEHKDYENPDFQEHVEWGKRLRQWRQEIGTSRLADLMIGLSKVIPINDGNKTAYLEVYDDISAATDYLKQEVGINCSIPRSGMDLVERVACQRAKRKLEEYFKKKREEAQEERIK